MYLRGVRDHLRDPGAPERGQPQAAVPSMREAGRRVVSAFAIGSARALAESAAADSATPSSATAKHSHTGHAPHAQPGRRSRPTVPDFARLCWMDDQSAERFAAYKLGRGAEYDDKTAAREDLRKRRGLPRRRPRYEQFPGRRDGRAQKSRAEKAVCGDCRASLADTRVALAQLMPKTSSQALVEAGGNGGIRTR